MEMNVLRQDAPCGAVVEGVDLTRTLTDAQVVEIRKHWLEHQVLAFIDQDMAIEDIERFALTIGPYGSDPFFESIPGHPHVAQVRRDANEKTPLFAETWHSDWSFMAEPPAATLLYGNVVPPIGGDTLFSNQYAAWETLPANLKSLVAERRGIHSAGRAYARDGAYGEKDTGRSMKIRYSDEALAIAIAPPCTSASRDRARGLVRQPGLHHRHRRHERGRSAAHPARVVRAPSSLGGRVSPSLDARNAFVVGQPLRQPCGHGWLRRARPTSASNHRGGPYLFVIAGKSIARVYAKFDAIDSHLT